MPSGANAVPLMSRQNAARPQQGRNGKKESLVSDRILSIVETSNTGLRRMMYQVAWGFARTGSEVGRLPGLFPTWEEAERAAVVALARWDNPACGAWVVRVEESS